MTDHKRAIPSLLQFLAQRPWAVTDTGLFRRLVNALLPATRDPARAGSAATWLRCRVTGGVRVPGGHSCRVPRVLLLSCARDRALADEVHAHLLLLDQQSVVSLHRADVLPAGVDVATETSRRLRDADIIVVLLSNDLLTDPWCQELLGQALVRLHAASSPLRVIPVPLRHCAWRETALGALQPLPLDGQPLTTMDSREEGLLALASGLRALAIGQ